MPDFPTYESQRQLTTQQPSFLAPGDSSGAIAGQVAKVGAELQEVSNQWMDVLATTQKTVAQRNFKVGMEQVLADAANDPDYNSSDKYFQQIEKMKNENLQGIKLPGLRSQMELELDYESKIGHIQVENLFKKKVIDAGRAASLDLLESDSKNGSLAGIQAEIAKQKKSNLFSQEELVKLENSYISKTKQNQFIADLEANPDAAGKKLASNEYGFDVTELEKARSLKEKSEKRRDEIEKEAKFNTAVDAGTAFVNGTLSQDSLREMVINGQMDAELAGAFELALFSPKNLKSWKSEDKNSPSLAGDYIVKSIESMDRFDPVSAQKIIKNALDEYNGKNSKIDEKDLTWIIRAIDEKRKAPDNPIWSSLTQAVTMVPESVGAGAMKKFMQAWDFQKDPRPVMKQAVIDQQKEDNPELANYEIDTVIKRRSGSYRVVGYNEDGKPVFRKE